MFKSRSLLNFLVITLMLLITAFASFFIYTSLYLKNRFVVKLVQKTDMVSEIITKSAFDLLSMGHEEKNFSRLYGLSNIIGMEEIGVYNVSGTEIFRPQPLGGRKKTPAGVIGADELSSFKKAIFTMNSTGIFDSAKRTYSRYVPLRADTRCASCHLIDKPMGVLKIRLDVGGDYELLGYIQRLIWIIGVVAFLPMAALIVAVAIMRDKTRLFSALRTSNSDLQKTYNKLNGIKSYLQMIVDNSRAIIVTTDTRGRVVEFNREGERVLGYSKEEVSGKNVEVLFEDQGRSDPFLKDWVTRGGAIRTVRNKEVIFRAKSGKLIYISLTLSTMINDEGDVIGTVAIGKDISEQKMLQFKLMQSEKLAGIGTLATGIAHEINNPLAGVLGMGEAIKDEDDVEVIKSYADDIIRYASSAAEIVKELSSYSRSAKNEADSTIDLSTVMESALKMSRHSVSFSPINVVMELDEKCFIVANQGEIQQVFVNLIINAVHAMGECGTLTLKSYMEGGFVKAVVSDTGHGIPEEFMSSIYDPFFTTKPVGLGTGLGLYVVYRIVIRHNGTIEVDTKVGKGTTFVIKFPASEPLEPIST
ncbi:MAG: nitrogen regulation protein NR(II) [Thermodesulfobacteriota bacterium]